MTRAEVLQPAYIQAWDRSVDIHLDDCKDHRVWSQRMEKVGRCRDREFDRTATLTKLRHRCSAKWKGRLAEREMCRRVD
jgi:hypothetical protein